MHIIQFLILILNMDDNDKYICQKILSSTRNVCICFYLNHKNMIILRFCFVLWKIIRTKWTELHLAAKSCQKLLREFRESGNDIKYLKNCKSSGVYPYWDVRKT